MADQLAFSTTSIHGVGQQMQGSSSRARMLLSSFNLNFQKDIDVFILPQLMEKQPPESIDEELSIPSE